MFRTFTLASAQTIEVPAATTDLDFEFFDAANNSVFTYTQGFAPEVIVKNVPTSAKRVVITARGPNGPLATIEANVAVTPGGQTVVDLSGATITLLGQLIVEPETLQFAPGGLIGVVDDLLTLVGNGGIDNVAFFRVHFIPSGETEPVEVTPRVGVHFENFFPSTLTADSFAHLNLMGDGIAITANPLGPTPPFGAKADMVVTYIQDGQVYTDRVEIVLDNTEFVGVEVEDLVLPANGAMGTPVIARAVYSNGMKLPIEFDASNQGIVIIGFGDTFALSVQTPATGLNLGANGVLTTTGGGGGQTAVLAISANGGTPTTFNVGLVDGIVSEVALIVSRTEVDPISTYRVMLTYNDPASTTVDFTQ
ncbi:MAG: hypothetical protein WC423_27450, partial [Vulcanimicrobiota bacterium]